MFDSHKGLLKWICGIGIVVCALACHARDRSSILLCRSWLRCCDSLDLRDGTQPRLAEEELDWAFNLVYDARCAEENEQTQATEPKPIFGVILVIAVMIGFMMMMVK